MGWTTPAEVDEQVRRLWDRGRLLVPIGEVDASFPLSLRLRRPSTREMSDQFDDVRRWIKALDDASKPRRGFGYEIRWTEFEHRQLGRNRFPEAVFVPTLRDALRLVGKQRQADRFGELSRATVDLCPALGPWVAKKPMVLLEHADDWGRILSVVGWLRDHPRPGVYLRQLEIPGVDTKFVETRKGLLTELLDLALDPDALDPTAGRNFEARYGLRSKPLLVRVRLLDPRQHIGDLSDVTVPASQFARMVLPAGRIFITENEINGLAFPDLPDSAVVFGLGYGVDRLAEVAWLRDKDIQYWGDIDTHGFAILDRLRSSFPRARSLLMDRGTLLAHRHLWVHEDTPTRGRLPHLTPEEQDLFQDLASCRMGERVRLEQERIDFGCVRRTLAAL